MNSWEKWQKELLCSLQDITTYSHLGLVFTLIPNEEISIAQEEKELHLSIKAMVYKKYYNSISPPRWNWNDSLASAKNNLMVFINNWLKIRGVL
jgi:hypothetical protein|uniref:Uncharacterized protein n=1 Tax=Bacteriophage sp. TaxID=38018 RepID=A0A8D9PEX3_9VIRU|nr:MAG TPA: hypothetical protein [Bacteriophage sp.]